MTQWLRNKFAKKRPSPEPIAPYKFGLTLVSFRADSSRVKGMRELMRTPLFQDAMSVLQHEIPLNSIDAVIGYRMAMRVIESMAEFPVTSDAEVPATYGAHHDFPELLTNQPEEQTKE